jgi:PAS domain S-box-containing protein
MVDRPFSPRKILAAVLVFAFVFIGVLLQQSASRSEESYRRQAISQGTNLVSLLERSVGGAIHEVDLAMLDVVDVIEQHQRAGGVQRDMLEAVLSRKLPRLPQIVSLRVADANGVVRYGAGVAGAPMTSIADRSFFIGARDQERDRLVISEPVFARISKQWVLTLARGFHRADGAFAGIVYANISLDTLRQSFGRIDVGPAGVVSMFDPGLRLIVREPDLDGGAQGKAMGTAVVRAQLEHGQDAGFYQATSINDGIFRIYAFRKLAEYPLYLNVGLAEQDFLAVWRHETIRNTALAVMFLLVLLMASWQVDRAWHHAARGTAALKQATQDAEAARLRSEMILASAGEGICGLDGGGRIVFINPAARRLLGWNADEGEGLELHSATHHSRPDGSPYPQSECPAFLTLQDGETRHVPVEVYWRRDGTPVSVAFTAAAIRHHGKVVGAVTTFSDIGERLAAERQVQAALADLARSNSELEQFAYVVSHDLRQPLRMVSSYLGLIQRRFGPQVEGDLKDFLDFAIDGAKRMDLLIRDLLEYSRVGRHGDAAEPVALAEVVGESLRNLGLAIADSGAEVTVAEGLPSVTGYRIELIRLFQNLIGNAVTYRHPERRCVVEVGCREQGGDWVAWVKDNGIGIAPADQERVFGVFQRLVSDDKGTGIGLAVCKKIVTHHGGRIWIESAPDEGATFLFTLPRAG